MLCSWSVDALADDGLSAVVSGYWVSRQKDWQILLFEADSVTDWRICLFPPLDSQTMYAVVH